MADSPRPPSLEASVAGPPARRDGCVSRPAAPRASVASSDGLRGRLCLPLTSPSLTSVLLCLTYAFLRMPPKFSRLPVKDQEAVADLHDENAFGSIFTYLCPNPDQGSGPARSSCPDPDSGPAAPSFTITPDSVPGPGHDPALTPVLS